MNCENYKLLISMYVDNEISVSDKIELEEHLKTCPDCRMIVSDYYSLKNKIKQYNNSYLEDSSFMASLVENIENKRTIQKNNLFKIKVFSLAFCLVIVLFSGLKIKDSSNKQFGIFEQDANQFLDNEVMDNYYKSMWGEL